MFVLSLLLPFIGTALGSSAVFLDNNKNKSSESVVTSFTGGLMLSAAIWSLLIPALEFTSSSVINITLSVLGFIAGFLFVIKIESKSDLINKRIEVLYLKADKSYLIQVIAIILHNIPEGIAVGALLSSFTTSGNITDLKNAFALSVGIAVQNIPEGSITSIPAHKQGNSKCKAFVLGIFSGFVELLGALITLVVSKGIYYLIPFFMSFSSGTMACVVVNQIIPQNFETKISVKINLSFVSGFLLMMILDNIF